MVERYFNRSMRFGITEVNILGFGKFGRDLLEIVLLDLEPDESITVTVVDIQDRHKEVCELARQTGAGDQVRFSQAAIQDIELLDGKERAFFLCTDDDLGNLTGALQLAGKADCIGCTHIYVRMGQWPLRAVTEHLGEDRGIRFININELVVEGIEELPGIFTVHR
jgi:hypothetical protein